MDVRELQRLPPDIMLSSIDILLQGGHIKPGEVLSVLEILSDVSCSSDSSTRQRSYVLSMVSSMGLGAVENLCLRVSGSLESGRSIQSVEGLRDVIDTVCSFLGGNKDYPDYIDVLSDMSFRYLLHEYDRLEDFRYTQSVLYCYSPMLPYLKNEQLRQRVANIYDLVSFS